MYWIYDSIIIECKHKISTTSKGTTAVNYCNLCWSVSILIEKNYVSFLSTLLFAFLNSWNVEINYYCIITSFSSKKNP